MPGPYQPSLQVEEKLDLYRSVSLRRNVGVLIAAIVLVATTVSGQVIEITTDLNTPSISDPLYEGGPVFEANKKFALRGAFLSSNYAASEDTWRWGVAVGVQSLEVRPAGSTDDWARYRATSLCAMLVWALIRKSRWCLAAGASGGVVSISKDATADDYCDSFCVDFDGGLRAGIQGRLEFEISNRIGLVAGVRTWIWTPSKEEMFPFENGPVYSVGIHLR